MAFSTAAPAAELQPAGPLDVRCMPRMLRAFHQDAGFSKKTAKKYLKREKNLFTEDRIAIQDMGSESYIGIVKQHHAKHIVQALQRTGHGSEVMG